MERLEARFIGHVQGVGFRYTTRRLASRWPLVGYVANQEDGSVLMIAEGARAELIEFLDAVVDAMRPNIRETQSHWYPATGVFEGFEIRR